MPMNAGNGRKRITAAERQERMLAIRGRAVAFVRSNGEWRSCGETKLLVAERGPISVGYRTPFQKLPAVNVRTGYIRALLGGKANLPYGLDIWHEHKKVLNIEWDDQGGFKVLSYKPGEWEWLLSSCRKSAPALPCG
jgi:hypothetical protein